jgi:rhamnose utilization protein RhaD (predicted bifunctional aldolase and dehydrogenase)/NAD(P)-dependent dehydrogenase (short-subunit alcohol dehydrogenase family)
MRDLWDDDRRFDRPLDACVYGSRLLGSDPSLVLHGGGNTSVKAPVRDITGRTVDTLHVKGSGWDLATIEAAGFTPLRLERLHQLLELDTLADPDMMRELSAASLDPDAPAPSVETLLHAFLPFPGVQHSHADVIVTLTNLSDGEARVREVYGDRVIVVPYVMPGFDLAKAVVASWPRQPRPDTVGMVLMNHGLFTFGDDTRRAYQRHVTLITAAEEWLDAHAPPDTDVPVPLPDVAPAELAELRRGVSRAAGRPMIVTRHTDEATRRFVNRPDLASLAERGPLTPDHVIRTKRVAMVGRDVDAYTRSYERYYAGHEQRARTALTMLDPAPRIVVDPVLGLLAVGESPRAAGVAADVYHHTMPVIARAEDHLGGYQALPASDLFDVEYWDLEQAKLRRAGTAPPLTGTVALVTGAASGIGRACAAALLAQGAAVVGLDRAPGVGEAFDDEAWLGLRVDVTDHEAQSRAVGAAVEAFGGIDIAVLSAGAFGSTSPLAELDREEWRTVMAVNLDAAADLMSELHPMLSRSPVGGSVVLIASKNVPAPGRGAAAYSASKAALTQLMRVAALEWAGQGIRVNAVHPDAVFDTGLWTEERLAERAARYDMTVDEYKRRNLLGAEVSSQDVAAAVTALCTSTFAATTGAQIPVDGGNERVV